MIIMVLMVIMVIIKFLNVMNCIHGEDIDVSKLTCGHKEGGEINWMTKNHILRVIIIIME
jgi:hypothetical protein